MTYAEKYFPTHGMLKWGGWFQTIYFDWRKIYSCFQKRKLKNMNSDKQISVLKCTASSFSKSKSLSQLQNCNGPLLRLRLMFLSFLQSVLPPNWTILLSVSSWLWEFSNSKTPSASYIQICALGLTYWVSGQITQVQNDVSGEITVIMSHTTRTNISTVFRGRQGNVEHTE